MIKPNPDVPDLTDETFESALSGAEGYTAILFWDGAPEDAAKSMTLNMRWIQNTYVTQKWFATFKVKQSDAPGVFENLQVSAPTVVAFNGSEEIGRLEGFHWASEIGTWLLTFIPKENFKV